MRLTPSYSGLRPASPRASAAARGASKKTNTKCEVTLRRELWRLGLRYRVACADLPGQPDIVLSRARVAVFCDGDFWHGRNWRNRARRLAKGRNAPYWLAKIKANMKRDRRHAKELESQGWEVMRFWETDIRLDAPGIAARVAKVVRARVAKLSR